VKESYQQTGKKCKPNVEKRNSRSRDRDARGSAWERVPTGTHEKKEGPPQVEKPKQNDGRLTWGGGELSE